MKQSGINYKRFIFFCTFLSSLQINCFYPYKSNVLVQESSDGYSKIQSYTMLDNTMSFSINNKPESIIGALNPGKIIKNKGDIYYFLNFNCIGIKGIFRISSEDEMQINIKDRIIHLKAKDADIKEDRVTVYFEIKMLDLIEMSNAETVNILIYADKNIIEGTFNEKNKKNYQEFTIKYIYENEETLAMIKSGYKRPWGFQNAGYGKGFEAWISKYIHSFSLTSLPNLSDFISLGIGWADYDYKVFVSGYNYTYIDPNPGENVRSYLGHYSKKGHILYFNTMYGVSHPVYYANWSLEIGITAQYYLLLNSWPEKDTYDPAKGIYPPEVYRVQRGGLYKGLTFGYFLQLGYFWFRNNQLGAWAAGIVFPL